MIKKSVYMKRHTKLALTVSLALIFSGLAAAQNANSQASANVDTVILASTQNHPDALMAGAPSKKLGIPVLLTDESSLSAETDSAINNLDPENVVIVGGPAVISNEVQTQIEEDRNTTRLWGTTQTGTSVKVSNYFWTEGSNQVNIVQYSNDDEAAHRMMAAVKNRADGSGPILVSKEGTLSASVLAEVSDLGATEAHVYSTNAVNVTEDLKEVGVQTVEVTERTADEIADQLNNQVETEGKNELVIIAASNFRNSISTPSSANSASMIISSESQISTAVNAAANAGAETEIKVVGNPDLAATVKERIEAETEKEVEVKEGEAEENAADEAENDSEEWSEAQEERMTNWKNELEASAGLKTAANATINAADRRVDENSSDKSQQLLADARAAYESENYFKARKLAIQARSKAHIKAFSEMSPEEIRENAEDEREDIREAAMELKELNAEMSAELRSAGSAEERLEIISEYKEERRETREERREERRERDDDEEETDNTDDRNETERENETDNRTDNDDGAMTTGNGELEARAREGTLEVKAEYVGNTGGYTVDKTSTQSDGAIDVRFDFQSPDGPATQAITKYEAEVEESIEAGNHTINAVLAADGEVVEELNRDFQAGAETEFRARVGADIDGN
jgi:putative cell wall-binding protein